VPFYDFKGHRDTLLKWGAQKEDADRAWEDPSTLPQNGIKAYWTSTNLKSIDGLPGLQTAHESTVPFQSVFPQTKVATKMAANNNPMIFAALGFVAGAILSALAVHLRATL
jgi:hypothetical protein